MSFNASILLWDLWCLSSPFTGFPDRSETRETFPRTGTVRSQFQSGQTIQSQSSVQRDDFGFCWTVRKQQFVSCTSDLLEQMYDCRKTHNVPPEVDFESSRSPAKSESWNSPSLHFLEVSPTWQYCLYSQVWWIYEINRFRRLSKALVHFVIDRASLFTDHRISGPPILAKYKRFRTIWEHTCDKFPTDFISSSSLKWWSSMHGVDTL